MSWTDQPKELEGKRVVLSLWLDTPGKAVEVRKDDLAMGKHECVYYITTGNLFGSQTVSCEGAEKVFFLLNWLAKIKHPKTPYTLPEGYELMDNAPGSGGREED